MKAVDTRKAVGVSTIGRPVRSLATTWSIGTGIAVLVVVTAYLVAAEVSGPLAVAGAGEVTLGNVIGFTVFGGTVGAVIAYVIGRFARRPGLAFLAVTLIALTGYAVVPFTAAESLATAIWLNVFHLVVAVPVIGMLSRYLRTDRTPAGA